jgi:hypothetical protein
MKNLLPLLLILTLAIPVYSQSGWRNGEMEVRVTIRNAGDAKTLHDLRLNGDNHPAEGCAVMYVIPAEFQQLRSSGLVTEILKEDLNAYYRGFWSGRADQYHSYEQIIALMDSLATAFPDICRKTLYGLTPEGRQMASLTISDNVTADENEPEVLFDGGIHGDEIGGPENLIRFARYLCTSYGSDPVITDLVDTREITIYPMVNPDGRANMSRYNHNMVDCNRDWGYMWNGEGNSPELFSQPETRTIRDCIYDHHFAIHITYHSGEEVVLYPWCYRAAHVPDFAALTHLSALYSSVSGYSSLQYRQSYADYPTNGETIDYSYGEAGTAALTMEISNNKQPAASQIQHYFDINLPSMIEMVKNAGYGIEGTVTDSITGNPVQAAIFVSGLFPVYSDPAVGDFQKYLTAGTYSVKVVANDYETRIISGVAVADQSSTVLNIQMKPVTGLFAMKNAAVAIPGGNNLDEAFTPAIIGAPDSVNFSLGKDGLIIADMQDTIPDIEGDDITIYEGDDMPEGYSCEVSETMDGPWILLGNGMGTTPFDLASAGVSSARFIRIQDDGDGLQTGQDAGFDLDAIGVSALPSGVSIKNRDNGDLVVYPNPANDVVYIINPVPGSAGRVEVYDLSGRMIIQNNITEGKDKPGTDIHILQTGTYVIRLITAQNDYSGSFVVMKQK